jgi:hypothetical protein
VNADFSVVLGSPEAGALVGDLVQHRGHFHKPKVRCKKEKKKRQACFVRTLKPERPIGSTARRTLRRL